MRLLWLISKWAWFGLLGLLLMFIGTALLLDSQHRPDVGCYLKNEIVGYVECRGFVGSNVLAFILILPLWVFFYSHAFLWYEISHSRLLEFAAKAPLALLLQVLGVLWLVFGLAYPFYWLFLRFKRRAVFLVRSEAGKPGTRAHKGKSR
jgi:hypothetical protein